MSSYKRIYNRVMDDRNNICPLGELLTDRELERIHTRNLKRDWPNTAKVRVKAGEAFFCFGVRFAKSYELIQEKIYIATFWRGNPQLKTGGYPMTEEFRAISLQDAEKQAERYATNVAYGYVTVTKVELKQENNG